MYRFEIVPDGGKTCVRSGSSSSVDGICERIYDAVLELLGGSDDMMAIEASSWAELYCGTEDDPSTFEMDNYTLYFWEE